MEFVKENDLVAVTQLFSKEECDKIKAIADSWPKGPAKVYKNSLSDSKEDITSRKGTVALISNSNPDYKIWFESVYHLRVVNALAQYIKRHPIEVDLTQINYQYTIYDQPKDKFNLHADLSCNSSGFRLYKEGVHRKLSVSIELDDPTTYEGATLYVETNNATPRGSRPSLVRFSRAQGTALFFPSYVNHEVSELTSGVRRSMVVWFNGPWWQ